MPSQAPEKRPDPDALLARVLGEEARARRGRLKIFFGASAGVGKSYAMLEAARKQAADGVDVVIGYVELHGRPETEALLEGLEILPPRLLEHRGIVLKEFDLDAALARHPKLLLVDELAHSNHPGARHPKRWHDVMELLDACIDVYTTVNVQHVESLNDVVAQITGVRVRETIPDSVFESADEVELIDLPPDDLLERLQQGKVYVPDKARRAVEAFFRKGNLIALRQLALRATADRVDAAMREYRAHAGIGRTWPAGQRLLVCVGPDPLSERLVRATRRLAFALHAEWFAAYVETPRLQRLPQAARDRVIATLKLAESLGAETANLSGESVAETVLAFARERNVSRIVVGKPLRSRLQDRLRRTLVDELIVRSGDIDVYVITGEPGEPRVVPPRLPTRRSRWSQYAKGVAVVLAATLICLAMFRRFENTNLVMVYLLATVVVAARFGRGPSVLAAVLSVGLFDLLFVQPYFSFAVSDTQYLITFAVMLGVGLLISHLTALGRRQAAVARHRERRTARMYALSRKLARVRDLQTLADLLRRHVTAAIEGEAAILLPDPRGYLQDPGNFCGRAPAHGDEVIARLPVPGNELGIAQYAYDRGEKAGLKTDTLASATAIYLPLRALDRRIGVLGLRPRDPRQLEVPEQVHLLENLVAQAAMAMERVQLADTAQAANVQIETERQRNLLLSAISHDFRTPLSSIIGAASTLLEDVPTRLDEERRRTLLRTLLEEARRMNRLVGDLLDLTRFGAGAVTLKPTPVALEELAGAVLERLREPLAAHPVEVHAAADLPLVPCDEVMIEQVLVNLIENAAKHTPGGTRIEVGLGSDGEQAWVLVRDHGPGLPAGEEERVFEKFHRARTETAQGGFGLGLTLCRYIVEAHGGRIEARNHSGGGAEFRFTLPLRRTEAPTA